MNVDVIGLGESSIDYVYIVPKLPGAGTSKVSIRSHFSACGGQVATTMAACAAMGLRAGYLGPVGSDANGARVRAELEARGVDVSRLIVRTAETRYAVILVDESSGDRQVLWERDPRLLLEDADLTEELFASARVLHVDAVDEAASIRAATLARAKGLVVTSDIDTVTSRTPELLAAVTVAIVAEHVPQQLTGEPDLERAMRAIYARHAGTSARSTSHVARRTWLLCVTLGERGAAALDGDDFHHIPAIQVDAVDTTGAGDVFRAAMIFGILANWDTPKVLRFANAAAGVSCTRPGALGGVPTLNDINARLQ